MTIEHYITSDGIRRNINTFATADRCASWTDYYGHHPDAAQATRSPITTTPANPATPQPNLSLEPPFLVEVEAGALPVLDAVPLVVEVAAEAPPPLSVAVASEHSPEAVIVAVTPSNTVLMAPTSCAFIASATTVPAVTLARKMRWGEATEVKRAWNEVYVCERATGDTNADRPRRMSCIRPEIVSRDGIIGVGKWD